MLILNSNCWSRVKSWKSMEKTAFNFKFQIKIIWYIFRLNICCTKSRQPWCGVSHMQCNGLACNHNQRVCAYRCQFTLYNRYCKTVEFFVLVKNYKNRDMQLLASDFHALFNTFGAVWIPHNYSAGAGQFLACFHLTDIHKIEQLKKYLPNWPQIFR